ncbi:MAG TPA: TonB family protein, partial [Blastocatellia bacterium]|nr:TonB family protein [Blastocatellia bacterium]
ASSECFEIARMYEARGDTARGRDYTVRAERLAQSFKDSGSLTQTSAPEAIKPEVIKKDELQTTIPNSGNEKPETRETANKLESTGQQAPQKAVSVPAATAPLKMVVEKTSMAEQSTFNVQVNDTALALATREDQSLVAVDHAVPAVSDNFQTATLLTARPVGKTAAEKQTKRWLYAAVIAFAFLAAIAVTLFKILPAYEARLDKEYQSLAQVVPLSALPEPSDSAPIEDNEPIEQVEVRATDSPATDSLTTQPTKPVRPEEDASLANPQPTTMTPQPSPGVVAASEPPKATRASSPALPVLPSAQNVQGGSESAAPKGMPNYVPGNASSSPDLPPPPAATAAARKPSATTVRGEPVSRTQPAYPQLAKSTGQSGMVIVEVTISEKGDVVSARATSGPSLLRDAAISAARRWKFKPSTRDGKPVSSVSTLSFNFKL